MYNAVGSHPVDETSNEAMAQDKCSHDAAFKHNQSDTVSFIYQMARTFVKAVTQMEAQ